MHDFHVSKVSGANGVLDIYIDNPKSSKTSSNRQCQIIMGLIFFITIYQANIFGQKPSFQTKYFRWNTDFSKVLFSAKNLVFKRNIFGDAGTFQSSSFV